MTGILLNSIFALLAVKDKINNNIYDYKSKKESLKNGDIVYMTALGKHRLVSNNRLVIDKLNKDGDYVLEDLYNHKEYYNYSKAQRNQFSINQKIEDNNRIRINREKKEEAINEGKISYKSIDEKGHSTIRRVSDDMMYWSKNEHISLPGYNYIIICSDYISLFKGCEYLFCGINHIKNGHLNKYEDISRSNQLIEWAVDYYNKQVDRNIRYSEKNNIKSLCIKYGIVMDHITLNEFIEKYNNYLR